MTQNDSTSVYTKRKHLMQYTEVVYYRDDEEVDRMRMEDDFLYSTEAPEPMTQEEIEDCA